MNQFYPVFRAEDAGLGHLVVVFYTEQMSFYRNAHAQFNFSVKLKNKWGRVKFLAENRYTFAPELGNRPEKIPNMNRFRFFILLSLPWLLFACGGHPPGEEPESTTGQTSPEPEEETVDWPMEDGYIALNWPDLAIPDYRVEFNEEIQQEVNIPIFRDEVKKLDGRLVVIKGFFFPFEDNPDEPYYVLSQFPFSQCFFCGAAGPESVMDLLMKSKPGKMKMDDYVTFKGRLRLNDNDVMYLNYILEEAEWMGRQ